MSAAEFDLVIEQGTDFDKDLLYKINGSPVDLTGFTAEGKIRKKPSDPVVAEFTVNFATDRTSGIFTISLSKAQTLAIPTGESDSSADSLYQYDVMLTDGTDKTIRLLKGKVTVSPAITKE